jgi:hypothetical protein
MATIIGMRTTRRTSIRAPVCSNIIESSKNHGGQDRRILAALVRSAVVCVFFCAAASAAQPTMHDLPQDTMMHAFLEVRASEADLWVRVPLDLLHGISWPTNHGEYAIAESGEALSQALDALGHALILKQNGDRLTPTASVGRLSALGDPSFTDAKAARAYFAEPADPNLKIAFDLGYLDAHFRYAVRDAPSVFSIRSRVAEDLQDLSRLEIRFMPAAGYGTGMSVSPASGEVALNPGRAQVAIGFVWVGVQSLATSADSLLFLACLLIPSRRLRDLIALIAAFAFGTAISLAGSSVGFAPDSTWIAALAAVVSALMIFLLALGNVFGAHLRRRRLWTGIFGLLSGFEFAKILVERVQFAGTHSQVALWFFSLGLDIGTLLAFVVMVAALTLVLRGARSGRIGIIVLSVIAAHAAWHWMSDRAMVFWQIPWPLLTMAGFYRLMQWTFVALIAAGAYRLAADRLEKRWPQGVADGQ